MYDLFGSGLPLAARFFIAFLVVLALIGVTAWLVRRFGANRLSGAAARGRQPRLAVIDAASVDGRRRLLLIRRDNVEHLLMIGGPSDVVIEANIVRATGAREMTREPPRVAAGPEAPARPASAAENGWPLQPLTEPPPVAPARPYRTNATEEPWLAPEPGARPRPPEHVSAPDLSARPVPPEVAPPPRPEPPRVSVPPPVVAPPQPSAAPSQTDHNLAEMALQLEAALRRTPMPEGRPPVTDPLAAQVAKPSPAPKPPEPPPRAPLRAFAPRVEVKPEPKLEAKPEAKIEPKVEAKPELKPAPLVEAKPAPAPAPPDKKPFDDLEAEMASLLGRPSGKT